MMRLLLIILIVCIQGCITKPTPPKVNKVQEIRVQVTDLNKVEKNDLSFFRLKISPKIYELSIHDKRLATNDLDAIDQFLTINYSILDTGKVALRGVAENYNTFERLKPTLRKHNIKSFRIERD